jgi:pyridoxamine 5'-phosphate oxidase
MKLADVRRDYGEEALDRASLDKDPFVQFNRWLEDAGRDDKITDPTAMTLATASAKGEPLVRTVLLKGADEKGFLFFSNHESRKARHIRENPNVSLHFPWLSLQRQVIVVGRAEAIATTEALRYFATRPRESQIAAWASRQSTTIRSRQFLEMEWERMKAKFANGAIPLPSFWGGYRVKPKEIEFWQGRSRRLHDRFVYTLVEGGAWQLEQRAP